MDVRYQQGKHISQFVDDTNMYSDPVKTICMSCLGYDKTSTCSQANLYCIRV